MDWLEELKNMGPLEIPEDAIENGLGMINDLAIEWHKTRPDSWLEGMRVSGLKQWKDNDARRKSNSIKMKETWEKNRKFMTENARQNGRHGLSGKDIHNTLDIEYKGVIYYGYKDLMENTAVSKHLYNKYYLNGIDPEPRIGKDGPVKGTKYNV
jgi:hypothetical protein|tara:strand:- start:950 stop:1411 length:462 start_codon:yes stop_codon:yes gene_type:complete